MLESLYFHSGHMNFVRRSRYLFLEGYWEITDLTCSNNWHIQNCRIRNCGELLLIHIPWRPIDRRLAHHSHLMTRSTPYVHTDCRYYRLTVRCPGHLSTSPSILPHTFMSFLSWYSLVFKFDYYHRLPNSFLFLWISYFRSVPYLWLSVTLAIFPFSLLG